MRRNEIRRALDRSVGTRAKGPSRLLALVSILAVSFAATPAHAGACGHDRDGDGCGFGEVLAAFAIKQMLMTRQKDPNPDELGPRPWPFGERKKALPMGSPAARRTDASSRGEIKAQPEAASGAHQIPVERIEIQARDGFPLGGYLVRALEWTGEPRGYVLVGQQNAALAERRIHTLATFALNGFDAYVFDYRGVGVSKGGSTRMKRVFEDYADLISALNSRGYERRTLYGASFGGMVFLQAIAKGAEYDIGVFDSTPSCINLVSCPMSFEPLDSVPTDASKLVFIAGGSDRQNVLPLGQAIQAQGGRLFEVENFRHVFEDRGRAIRRCRLTATTLLLIGQEPSIEELCAEEVQRSAQE